MPRTKQLPKTDMEERELPSVDIENKELPDAAQEEKEMPVSGIEENTVIIGGKRIEIKPTLLRYMRNRTAEFYHILDVYPLPDILATKAGVIDEKRDGDKCLMDWLIAVTNDEKLIREHYDDMDADVIMRMLEIFKRINRIKEKEDEAKNRQAAGKVV